MTHQQSDIFSGTKRATFGKRSWSTAHAGTVPNKTVSKLADKLGDEQINATLLDDPSR